jgi:hypothetical protein
MGLLGAKGLGKGLGLIMTLHMHTWGLPWMHSQVN